MGFLNIMYIEYNDGKPNKKSIYEKETSYDSIALHHSLLGNNMADATVEKIMCIAVSVEGTIIAKDAIARPVEPVEEETDLDM